MSESEQNEDPRRLAEIDGKEISLVDHAAIKRKFLIVKRAEDAVPREKISLEDEKDESAEQAEDKVDAGEEKASEGAVAQDVAQDPSIETDTASDGDEPAEKEAADPEAVMEAAAALMPWLKAQHSGADGELKSQIAGFLEALGQDVSDAAEGEEKADDSEEESEAEEEEAEKSAEGWEAQLDAVSASFADVAKGDGMDDEEDEEDMAKSDDAAANYVTAEQFDAFATKVTQAITAMASNVATVSKRADKLASFTPVSKGADDHTPPQDEVEKSETIFGRDFFAKRQRKINS